MPDAPWILLLLFASGLVAGWVDSIAGGGGLITIPILLSLGLPPQIALGTNKFQASFGSFTAATYYVRKGVVSLRDALPAILWTLVGAAIGTWSVQQIDPEFLRILIPLLLIGIAIYMLVAPPVGDHARPPRIGRHPFACILGLFLGFYDGFFGPGVGSFWAIAYMALLGYGMTRATGYTKVMNFTSNVVSLILFLAGGFVLLLPGIIMGVGQIVGARIGSAMVITRGARFIRPVFITVVLLTTLRLLYARFG